MLLKAARRHLKASPKRGMQTKSGKFKRTRSFPSCFLNEPTFRYSLLRRRKKLYVSHHLRVHILKARQIANAKIKARFSCFKVSNKRRERVKQSQKHKSSFKLLSLIIQLRRRRNRRRNRQKQNYNEDRDVLEGCLFV